MELELGSLESMFVYARLPFPSILVASNGRKTPLHQQIRRPPRFKGAADVIAQIDDLLDAERGNIREHGFQRDAVAMNIGDRGKFHRPTSLISWPMTTFVRECSEVFRFSCIYKSARKQVVKSALTMNLAS